MAIRLATPDDIAVMLPLINRAFEVETFLEGLRTTETELREMLGTGEFLVAEDAAGIYASVYTELRGGPGYFECWRLAPPVKAPAWAASW